MNADEKRNRSKRKKQFLIGTGVILLAVFLAGILLFQHYYRKMNIQKVEDIVPPMEASATDISAPEEIPEDHAIIEEEDVQQIQEEMEENLVEPVAEKGVYNLLLLGTDSRHDNYKSRTDTMMVVSINKEEKTIAISSFLRDIYILIPNFGYHRLNTANAVGGPAMLIDTIQQNFGISIDNYAFVNFYSFMDVIDILGGVDISLADEEVYYINYWVNDIDLQVDSASRTQLAYQADDQYHLNGMQALAYCRMRNIGADPGRTERQRNMMEHLWQKTQNMSIGTLTELADVILPQITTDISPTTCLSLLASVAAYKDFTVIPQQIPADGTFRYASIDQMSVLSIDFQANRDILQRIIFGKSEANE